MKKLHDIGPFYGMHMAVLLQIFVCVCVCVCVCVVRPYFFVVGDKADHSSLLESQSTDHRARGTSKAMIKHVAYRAQHMQIGAYYVMEVQNNIEVCNPPAP